MHLFGLGWPRACCRLSVSSYRTRLAKCQVQRMLSQNSHQPLRFQPLCVLCFPRPSAAVYFKINHIKYGGNKRGDRLTPQRIWRRQLAFSLLNLLPGTWLTLCTLCPSVYSLVLLGCVFSQTDLSKHPSAASIWTPGLPAPVPFVEY